MQDLKENVSPQKESGKSIVSIRAVLNHLKKLFLPWVIISVITVVFIGGAYSVNDLLNRTITVDVNFSFDGVESGKDPLGNKFDVNEIKSKTAIVNTVKEMGLENVDVDEIYSSIIISGNIPTDVIERITKYNSMYNLDEVATLKNIQDITYYPTQYTITMDCYRLDMDFDDCVEFLNRLTERYKTDFAVKYGYKNSLANAVMSFDYNDYDYNEAIDVFDSSLESLQVYIAELAREDSVRYRSENTGYTFSDIAKSIETIRGENLELLSSYITLYNMTKDKEHLIVNYEYRVEDYKRRRKINEDRLDAIQKTLDVYEKNSILIFAQATSGADATLNQSSETYDNLIEMEVTAKTNISYYNQLIDKYTQRIDNLKKNAKNGSQEKLEEDFVKLNEKINTLLENAELTVTEYYEDVVFFNAYEILRPASDSFFKIIKESVKNSFYTCVAILLFEASAYLLICVLMTNAKICAFCDEKIVRRLKNNGKKPKEAKDNKESKNNKNKKSKGGRK
ncbi:MAG: hypothetical protein IJA12_01680 [Oscillospiraceae bacterium]|nr:hypothetical protein [Oscillospiraceae bacterium]